MSSKLLFDLLIINNRANHRNPILMKSKSRYAVKRDKICKKNIIFGRRVEVGFERVNAGFKLCSTKERILNYK